jgi:hypothetical protein
MMRAGSDRKQLDDRQDQHCGQQRNPDESAEDAEFRRSRCVPIEVGYVRLDLRGELRAPNEIVILLMRHQSLSPAFGKVSYQETYHGNRQQPQS